jgi:hypothetical protein
MKDVFIIGEGQAEEEFVNNILTPYFKGQGVRRIEAKLLETSPGHFGGDITYSRFKGDLEILIQQNPNVVITSLLDYYELRSDFPNYNESIGLPASERVSVIERAIYEEFNHLNLFPYIQLHEFEALLYSHPEAFEIFSDTLTPAKILQLQDIAEELDNPEDLNDGNFTSPSNRLKRIFQPIKYKKANHGLRLAKRVGIVQMMAKCHRFNQWIQNITQLALQ